MTAFFLFCVGLFFLGNVYAAAFLLLPVWLSVHFNSYGHEFW